MSRSCSQCGNNGHNARTCTSASNGGGGGSSGEIMLFGVRVTAIRKSLSMNNLSQYEQAPSNVAVGYASDDALHNASAATSRKRGIPWTEEEHRRFLNGLQKVGKGDWRGISRNFVKTRTPTQVASHAQKYFLRHNNFSRRRRRSSLFDITTETFLSSVEEEHFPMEMVEGPKMLQPRNLDLDLNRNVLTEPSLLSLNLSSSSSPKQHSSFQTIKRNEVDSKRGCVIYVS